MEQATNYLKEVSSSTIKILDAFKEKGRKGEFSFEYDCATSQDYRYVNILEKGQFVELFDKLKLITGPVIYWIEVVSNTSSQDISNAAYTYKLTNERHVPAIKSRINHDSKIIYVGKVQNGIFVRVMNHMGFHASHKTQGLQMYHWGKDIGLKVQFHLMQLHEGCESILTVWEKALATKMKPIIGKHK